MTLFCFGQAQRLKCAADFKGVFDGALFKVHQPSFLFLAIPTNTTQSRIGLVVAKKKVRRAHERNRVKRLTRESFRLHQGRLAALDIVVMPKVGIEKVSNSELHLQLQLAWQKLQRIAHKHAQNHSHPVQS